MFSRPGFYSDQWVRHDPAFASLRRQPEFVAAIARWSTQRGLERLEELTRQGPGSESRPDPGAAPGRPTTAASQ